MSTTPPPDEVNYDERHLPADLPAERTILGAIMLDNEAYWNDTVSLTADDFSVDSHQRIYICMNEILMGMVEGVNTVDIRTLSDELHRRKWLGAVRGVSYLAELTEGLPRRPVINEYIRIVKDKAMLRRIMQVCSTGYQRAADQSEPGLEVLGTVESKLLELSCDGFEYAVSLGSVTPAVEAKVERGRSASSDRTALEYTWGIPEMDEFSHGAFRGEFTVLAAESSGGKTAAAVQMLLANAKEGTPVGFFSLEMTKEQVASRCYPQMSTVLTAHHLRDPRLMNNHTHIPEMQRISAELSKLPIMIDDTQSLRIDKLIARMRMMRRKFGVKLFAIDYLQLIETMPGMNEMTGFKKVVFALRDFPKMEPDTHVVALSQYSKAEGFMKGKKRTKDSLYGGSVIHHAAQNIVQITIEDPEKRDKNDLLDTEFRFAKQRDGRRGKVNCYYDRDHLLFTHPQPPLRG